jgi:hypothetical protein
MLRALCIVIVFFLISCGAPSPSVKAPITFEVRPANFVFHSIYKGAALHFHRDTQGWQRVLLQEAASKHIDVFCNDWDIKRIKPVDIYCFDVRNVPCGVLRGKFTGCHYGNAKTSAVIHVTYGKELTLPALYHELVHDILPGFDRDHTDKRWYLWDARCIDIHNKILEERLK